MDKLNEDRIADIAETSRKKSRAKKKKKQATAAARKKKAAPDPGTETERAPAANKPSKKKKHKKKRREEAKPQQQQQQHEEQQQQHEEEEEEQQEIYSERSRLLPIRTKKDSKVVESNWRQTNIDGKKVFINLLKMKVCVEKPLDYPRKGRGRDKCSCPFCLSIREGNEKYVAFLEARRVRHLQRSPRERKQRLLDFLWEIRKEDRFCNAGFHRTFALDTRLVAKSIELRDQGVMHWPSNSTSSSSSGGSGKKRSASASASGSGDRPLKRARREDE